jgi:plasmid stabilization system protein ParE
MSFAVKVDPEAEREWHDAVRWYGGGDPVAGHRFNAAILEIIREIARQPERFRRATKLTRKAKVPNPWPYSLYFTVDAEHREIRVLAVWHGARNPDELRRRLK